MKTQPFIDGSYKEDWFEEPILTGLVKRKGPSDA